MRCITVSILALAVCAAKGADDLKPGLIGEYFDMGGAVEDFPKVDDKKPAVRRLDREINWDGTGDNFAGTELADHFYVRWTGVLRVEKAGPYTLYTESDDGSRLWIDGKQVVDNGGLHGMEERSGKVELTAGDHEIKIDLFENEGEVGMKVSWQADGGEKKIIPAGAYFHKADEKLDKN
ncbi:MAG TPA: PA14 domain-containing protein [Planctomycetota bacterium]|nr:PA14 domain-containing protein [Planctomycetota bacterium]